MKTKSRISPEQRELEAKRVELAELETQLSLRELELTTLQAELRAFEARYLRVVGWKFAQRDELEAQIAEAVARRRPHDSSANLEAKESRARAAQSAEAADRASSLHVNEAFRPTDDLKQLYREIAKLVHPDLTTDHRERERRTRIMTAANRAFADGDQKELERILEEWETSPEFVEGEGVGAELVRTIRKIHQANQRLAQIQREFGDLNGTDLYALKEQFDIAHDAGRDLLAEMASQLDAEITELRERLDLLEKEAAT
jgi:hypothetical protein